ncbi:MAG: PAS domain S-box protein [Candidatus Sericytochromatia bacterium]
MYPKNTSPGLLYVAAIGASAGGLEALIDLLHGLDPEIENLALVIAQHMSPTHKSHLVELLGRETVWPVCEIHHGMALTGRTVFVIPPDSEVSFAHAHFCLKRPSDPLGPKPSADVLFFSLSQQPRLKALSLVLSGTGSDGARGSMAVKAAGGWTFAQDPETARYDSMPRAAIETGQVDFVLSPGEFGACVRRLIAHPELARASLAESLGEEVDRSETYQQVMQILTARTGTNFANYKSSTIFRRLQKRMQTLHLTELPVYLDLLQEQPAEQDALFRTLLIGVTSFFRDPEVFAALQRELASLLASKQAGDNVRIWVPGCATGEEAYTLALLLYHLLEGNLSRYAIQIFATDIDEQAVAMGRRGVYPAEALTHLPPDFQQRYFVKRDDHFEVLKAIRHLVLFSRHDVTVNPPFLKLDLISCRNLLIYFSAPLQKHLMPIFHYALQPDGLLLLGKSETVGPFTDLFSTLDGPLKLYRRRNSAINYALSLNQLKLQRASLAVSPPVSFREEQSLAALVRETLAHTYEHPYVLVNDNLDLLQVFGDVSDYLSLAQGRMTTGLLKLCRPDLQMELRALSAQAQREKRAATGRFRRWGEDQTLLRVHIKPVLSAEGPQDMYLVVFETVELPMIALLTSEGGSSSPEEPLRLLELEQELSVTQEYLQSFVEQLETSNEELQTLNEELQSTNEELQSTNEELETSNEELQSTNEEMQVAYAELRSANEVLERKEQVLLYTQANTQALLENTQQAFLLMDRHYQVLSFNPRARELHHEVYGRSLAEELSVVDVFSPAVFSQLLPLLQRALEGELCHETFGLETAAGKQYLRYTLMPVRSIQSNEILGLSITALDVSEQVQNQLEIEKSHALINSIFNATETGIALLNVAGEFVKVNQGFCQICGYTPAEMLGLHFTLLAPPEQRPSLQEAHDLFMETGQSAPVERKLQHKQGYFLDVAVSERLLVNPDGSRFKVMTLRDITESKRYESLLSDTQTATQVGGWEFDLIAQKLQWTSQVYAIYGLPLGTPIDADFALSPYPPPERKRVLKALNAAIQRGEACDLEMRFVRSGGEQIWVRATCKPIRVYNKTVKLFGTFQDITARKQADDELRKLSWVASQASNMVLITNAHFKVEYLNHSCERGTGYALAELAGESLWVLQGAETDPLQVLQMRQQMLAAQAGRCEIRLHGRSGQAFWAEFTWTPVLDDAGHLIQLIVILNDISERKQQEALLQFQSDVLSHVSEAIMVTNLEGCLTHWNRGAEQIFGYSAADMIGEPLQRIYPDFDLEPLRRQELARYQGQHEVICRRKDGSGMWVLLQLDALHNQQGDLRGMIVICREITEKKEMENALRQSEERLRALLENSSDGILVVRADRQVAYVSASAERLLGYAESDFRHRDFLALVHAEDQILLYDQLSITPPGVSAVMAFRFRHQSGRWIWLEATHRNMLAQAPLNGYVFNFRDISERKDTERQLREHEQLYRSIAENFPNGMVAVLDQQLNCLFSAGQESLPGTRLRDSQAFVEQLPPMCAEIMEQGLHRALHGEQHVFELELEQRFYLFALVPLPDKEQRIRRVLVVAQNISPHKESERDKNRLIAELTQKNEDLSQFTYIISHNLRAPVANLLGLVSIIPENTHFSTELQQIFQGITTTATKLDAMIRDLNEILNVRRLRDELRQPVALREEIERALDNLQLMEDAPRINVVLKVERIFTIRSYIQSILHNLLSNALKYRDPARPLEIDVRVWRENSDLRLSVSDNGLGLDMERHQGDMFRLYRRFHHQVEGKGMGLYLVKTQAEMLGGNVSVLSKPGVGTSFTVSLKEVPFPDAELAVKGGG